MGELRVVAPFLLFIYVDSLDISIANVLNN